MFYLTFGLRITQDLVSPKIVKLWQELLSSQFSNGRDVSAGTIPIQVGGIMWPGLLLTLD